MNDEPKASMNLDPEMIAAYIDKRLSPEQRAAVEAQLATDPDAYAVLVESMKALDEMPDIQVASPERADASRRVTFVPRAKTSTGWRLTIAAGVLAAAAALLLVVMQPEWLHRLRGDRVDPRLERLVAAVGEERYVEARLSGGFKYGPLKSTTRGEAESPRQNLSLVAAAGEIQKAQQSDPSTVNLHALGLAQLQLQDYDNAVRSLEAVAANEPTSATAMNDLAAAYGTRAQRTARADDWPRALDAIGRASAIDPQSNEVLFNRAWILEGALLRNQAIEAWQNYVQRDRTSPWANEARQRLEALQKQQASVSSPISAAQIVSTDLIERRADDEVAGLDPALTTVWIQAVVLDRWASAPDLAAEQRVVSRARVVTEKLHDRWIDDTLSCLRAGDPDKSAFTKFARAMKYAVLDEASDAKPLFEESEQLLRSRCLPLALAAAYHATTVDSQRGNFDKVLPVMEAIHIRAAAAGYSALQGLTLWRKALAHVRQGELEVGIRDYRRAVAEFSEAGQRQNAANMNGLIAETYRLLGDMRSAWRYHRRSMELASSVTEPRIHHQLFSQQSLSSLREGLSRAAVEYQEAMIATDREWGNVGALAMAYVQRSRSFVRLGEVDRAVGDSDQALQLLDTVPDPSMRLRVKAEAMASRAEAFGVDRADESTAAFLESRGAFSESGSTERAAAVTLQRGDVLWATGRKREAVEDWQAGLHFLEDSRRTMTDTGLRMSQASSMRPILERLASASLDRGDQPVTVVDFVERSRFQTTAEILNEGSRAIGIVEIQQALGPDVALIYYVHLTGRPLAVVVKRGAITIRELSLPTKRALEALQDTGDNFDALIRPILTELTGIKTLLMVPDGVTSVVRWAGLRDRASGLSLIESFRIAVIPSGTVYALLLQRASDQPLLRVSAFGYGDAAADEDLPALPFAQREAARVAERYERGRAWLGADASIDRFETALRTADIVHFAGHGVYNADFPMMSRLLLAPEPGGRSQLLVDDIAHIRGVSARVVVLAACRSAGAGSGEDEAALGLTRPLLAAGVSSVVATVRDVDDVTTEKLMTALHTGLSRGLSPGTALQQAQIELQRQGPPSVDWAAFAVYGLP